MSSWEFSLNSEVLIASPLMECVWCVCLGLGYDGMVQLWDEIGLGWVGGRCVYVLLDGWILYRDCLFLV